MRETGALRCGELWGGSCATEIQLDTLSCGNSSHSTTAVADLIQEGIDRGYAISDLARLNESTRNLTLPTEIVTFAQESARGKMLLARNPNTPEFVLEEIASTDNYLVLRALVTNPSTPPEVLEDIITRTGELHHLSTIAGDPLTLPSVLELLASNRRADIRQMVANNPSTPPGTLEYLVRDTDPKVQQALGTNAAATASILMSLARNAAAETRRSLIEHPNADDTVLRHLSKDPDWRVRFDVASSQRVEPDLLSALILDRQPGVVSGIASNPNCPQDLMAGLLTHSNYVVRFRLAQNPSITIPVFLELINDPKESVRQCLTQNTSTPYHYGIEDIETLVERDGDLAWLASYSKVQVPAHLRKNVITSLVRNQFRIVVPPEGPTNLANVLLLLELHQGGRITLSNDALLACFNRVASTKDANLVRSLYRSIRSTGNLSLIKAAAAIVREHFYLERMKMDLILSRNEGSDRHPGSPGPLHTGGQSNNG